MHLKEIGIYIIQRMIAWRPCPDFKAYECNADGDIQWKDGLHKGRGPVILYMVAPDKKPSRKYYSLTPHWTGHVHRQVWKAWGPPNPDPTRYTLCDHTDNNPLNDKLRNLRWSNRSLNALNTDWGRGWTYEKDRNKPYKAHIRWMGKGSTLGRFSTAAEAEAVYQNCKDFIQRSFREHKFEDKFLVWAWRALRNMRVFEVGTSDNEINNYVRQFGRTNKMLLRHLTGLGFGDNGMR